MKHFEIKYIWGFDTPICTTYVTANTKEEAIQKLLYVVIFLRNDMIISVQEI